MSTDVWRLGAVEQARMIRAKEISARELLSAHLERIDAVNPTVNAVVGMDTSVAEARAADIDELIASGGDAGPLGGLVTAHKDLQATADFVTTSGSPVFAEYRPPVDSHLVTRMKAAGAVPVGKTNTPEFGVGSHTFNPVYGVTRNPYDPSRSAGGSSGGAAAALAAGMVSIADGSDLGGSLRNPAAWNNVLGFRTSPGVVPRPGPGNRWVPLPIDGPMARTVDDLALLLRVLATPTLEDPLSHGLSWPDRIDPPSRPLRVAWSSNLGGLPVEPDVVAVLDRFRSDVEQLGWSVTDDEPDLSGADDCFRTLRSFLYVERHVQLGDQLPKVKDTVQEEIGRGLAQTSTQVSAAFGHLNTLWNRSLSFFDDYDLLLAPVTQVSPFPVEMEYPTEVDGVAMDGYLEWMRSCCRITVTGCPALSLPAGFTPEGLPVGVQVIAPRDGDLQLLAAAKALEAATGHGLSGPNL